MIGGSGRINIDLAFTGLNRLPNLGEEVYSKGFFLGFGGGAPGTLLLLHRMGIPVRLVTAIGDDFYSRFASDFLKKAGLEPVRRLGGACPCNLSVAMLTKNDRTFVSYGENGEIPWEISDFSACDFVLMGRGRTTDYRKLKSMGKRLILDLGDMSEVSEQEKEELFELADYWFPNRREWQSETRETDCKIAAEKLRKKMARGVLKLDKDGAYWYAPEGEGYVPAAEGNYSDSLGAGDAFSAGFLYGLEKGYSMEFCTKLGCLSGAKCVSGQGCHGAYYNEEEWEREVAMQQ